MAEVEILYPSEKKAIALRLQDALAQTGYEVVARAETEPAPFATVGEARALVIVWDRSSIWLPAMQEAARTARKAGRALEVSVDGITPIGLSNEAHLVMLSGWRGDAHHPGWKKLLAELNRLCGQPQSLGAVKPGEKVRARIAASATRSTATGEAAAGSRTRKPSLPLIVFGLLLASIIVAGAAWKFGLERHSAAPASLAPGPARSMPPGGGLPGTAHPESRSIAAIPNSRQQAAPGSASALAGGGGAASQTPNRQPADNEVVRAAPSRPTMGDNVSTGCNKPGAAKASCPGTHRAGRRSAGLPPAGTARANRTGPRGPAIRYTKYSKVMRQFCQRSGRDTPECRTFRSNR